MLNTILPQRMPTQPEPGDGLWAENYGDRLGMLYELEAELPGDFRELAVRIAERCAECDALSDEIDDIIIL